MANALSTNRSCGVRRLVAAFLDTPKLAKKKEAMPSRRTPRKCEVPDTPLDSALRKRSLKRGGAHFRVELDTRQVIARFEAEEQALAKMDHPNIAKVLDAGTTESGRPYFVMELVKGIAITEYYDQQHLSPKERLELFIPICQAVQHAHHKGIIHRDIKPSNILVAVYDGQPVPKVIDFGVAKATSRKLTEKTIFTHYGQIVGTLGYMSPEQVNLNQLDIDSRSDVYSLGVLCMNC
jgi:serine/threonine protein kinase